MSLLKQRRTLVTCILTLAVVLPCILAAKAENHMKGRTRAASGGDEFNRFLCDS
jgi:hypothetical protein